MEEYYEKEDDGRYDHTVYLSYDVGIAGSFTGSTGKNKSGSICRVPLEKGKLLRSRRRHMDLRERR